MTEDATDAQYKDLVSSIPDPADHVEIVYEVAKFRVLIANINDCDIKKLWKNPIVEAMSLDGPLILDDEVDDLPLVDTKRETFKVEYPEFEHAARNVSNVTAGLSPRAFDAVTNLKTQANSPWHLKLLSGLSFQAAHALTGLYYDFPGYLFADRSIETADAVSQVNIYVLDTGIMASHNVSLHTIHPKAILTSSSRTSLAEVSGRSML